MKKIKYALASFATFHLVMLGLGYVNFASLDIPEKCEQYADVLLNNELYKDQVDTYDATVKLGRENRIFSYNSAPRADQVGNLLIKLGYTTDESKALIYNVYYNDQSYRSGCQSTYLDNKIRYEQMQNSANNGLSLAGVPYINRANRLIHKWIIWPVTGMFSSEYD